MATSNYRYVGHLSPDNRPDSIQVAENKVLKYDPERAEDPVSLTEAQVLKAQQYVVLELVEDEPLVDPGRMGAQELREFAQANKIEGRSGKSEDELRTLVSDHLAAQEDDTQPGVDVSVAPPGKEA